MMEAAEREKLLRPLHTLEARISTACSLIKNQLYETVTFKGIPYVEKMKRDYGDIVRKCSKQKQAIKE
jgi:hypothetical protein